MLLHTQSLLCVCIVWMGTNDTYIVRVCVCLKAWYLKLEDIGMTIKFHIHVMLWLLCCRIKAFTVYQRLLSLILSYTHRCRWDCKDGNSVCHLYYYFYFRRLNISIQSCSHFGILGRSWYSALPFVYRRVSFTAVTYSGSIFNVT